MRWCRRSPSSPSSRSRPPNASSATCPPRACGFTGTPARAGKRVFLDMRLHDIESSVAKGVENVARLGVNFLTVHAYPQTMKAAVAARRGSGLKILAVTVLTSYDDIDLAESGYSMSVDALVARRAQQAHDLGVDGLVCSPEEASPLRLAVGHDMIFVTPGIRPQGSA